MKTKFSEAVDAVAFEREYQNAKWGTDKNDSIGDYLCYMQHHMNKAVAAYSSQHFPASRNFALDQIRKITALGMAAMEQHGIVHRTFAEYESVGG